MTYASPRLRAFADRPVAATHAAGLAAAGRRPGLRVLMAAAILALPLPAMATTAVDAAALDRAACVKMEEGQEMLFPAGVPGEASFEQRVDDCASKSAEIRARQTVERTINAAGAAALGFAGAAGLIALFRRKPPAPPPSFKP